jgi:CO dehydrogenase/acetyl-CoA synthase alpha subunit
MLQIIDDPCFETFGQPDSKWGLKTHQGVTMQSEVADDTLTLTITGTSGDNWHAEFKYEPFAVKKGDIYEVSFSAKAKTPFEFSVWLGQKNEPFKSLVAQEDHYGQTTMLDDWETFTHTWTVEEDEDQARLNFVLGAVDNVIELEDISLLRIDQMAQ